MGVDFSLIYPEELGSLHRSIFNNHAPRICICIVINCLYSADMHNMENKSLDIAL